MDIDLQKLKQTHASVRQHLIAAKGDNCYWQGSLSSSALATATAVTAFALTDPVLYHKYIGLGIQWLSDNANEDGGWGDTPKSRSNIATTMLCWAAFGAAGQDEKYSDIILNAQSWLKEKAGGISPNLLIDAIYTRYGDDRTFAVPILTMCALAGRLGDDPWERIEALPFELAVFPHRMYKSLNLSVVSYALAALIGIGQVHFHFHKPRCKVKRFVRSRCRKKTLKKLEKIQPDNGGFLEATPLTGFVVMSLAAMDKKNHPVTAKGLRFIAASMRDDGSWPIDTDLAVWLTTLSVKALSGGRDFEKVFPLEDRGRIRNWLLGQQFEHLNLYVHADPGGWAWTDQPGGVPDADDTAGALVVLRKLDLIDDNVLDSAKDGLKWLMDIQNKDGGTPTFCRGWQDLPFDRSAPDLTAHTIAAMSCWMDKFRPKFAGKMQEMIKTSLNFLKNSQRSNGSWAPLWFGNESADYQENPTYGTARALLGLVYMPDSLIRENAEMIEKAIVYLLSIQNNDGGWGGAGSVASSIEETSLAVDALAAVLSRNAVKSSISALNRGKMFKSVSAGTGWLMSAFEPKTPIEPTPIGLYFASLWYYEDLYPWIFALSALQKVAKIAENEQKTVTFE